MITQMTNESKEDKEKKPLENLVSDAKNIKLLKQLEKRGILQDEKPRSMMNVLSARRSSLENGDYETRGPMS